MSTNSGLIVNADDFGLSESVNQAILLCYTAGYINSSSFITNTPLFEDTVKLIKQNPIIRNLGLHGNFAEGKPLTNFKHAQFLDANGDWDLAKTQKYSNSLKSQIKSDFVAELYAQIDKALNAGLTLSHLDSHYHLHILPCFYNIFIQAAKKYNLKLRLSQTSHEHNLIKYFYRSYINSKIRLNNCNYSNTFENLGEFLRKFPGNASKNIELMAHPDMDNNGQLTDSVDAAGFKEWITHATQPHYNFNS
jgi:predicted glycoside hydrolase/deacetylase ChbG (UPF0249 family)